MCLTREGGSLQFAHCRVDVPCEGSHNYHPSDLMAAGRRPYRMQGGRLQDVIENASICRDGQDTVRELKQNATGSWPKRGRRICYFRLKNYFKAAICLILASNSPPNLT